MLVLVKNCEDSDAPTMAMITTTSARPVSQHSSGPSDVRSLSLMARSSHPQRSGEAGLDQPVQGDGPQEQDTEDRLVPERRDAEHVERGADRAEQQRAQRRPHRATAPAEY